MHRWVGRVALVTGASSGLGADMSAALVKEGMKVVGCGRNVTKLEDMKNKLQGQSGALYPMRCDFNKPDQIVDMMAKIDKDLGGADVVINSAGLSNNASLLTGEEEQWREMLDINVLALSVVTKEAVKSLLRRKVDDGQIIHVNSYFGHHVFKTANLHFYTGTKHMVKALLQGLRNEIRTTGTRIRVAEVSPGMVETEFWLRITDNDEKAAKEITSVFPPLKPEDVTEATLNILKAPIRTEIYETILVPTEMDTQFEDK